MTVILIETLLLRSFKFSELQRPDSVSSTRRHHATSANVILFGYFFQLEKKNNQISKSKYCFYFVGGFEGYCNGGAAIVDIL